MVYYISQDVNILSNNHTDVAFNMIESLFKYNGERVPSWLFSNPELMDIGASDNEVLSEFRRLVLKDYRDLTKNSSKMYENAFNVSADVDENFEVTLDNQSSDFARLLRVIIGSNNVDYLHFQKSGETEYVIVNTAVKNALKEFNGSQITCKGLADYMGEEYKTIYYKGTRFKGFRVEFEDFIMFLNGGFGNLDNL